MVTVTVQHEVKDFAEWKKVFDADNAGRVQAGVSLTGLYTALSNPNDVTMIFEASSAEQFGAMMSDPTREKLIKESGAITAPVVSILKKM